MPAETMGVDVDASSFKAPLNNGLSGLGVLFLTVLSDMIALHCKQHNNFSTGGLTGCVTCAGVGTAKPSNQKNDKA